MLFTIDKDPGRAARARENFARAQLSDRVSVIVGDAQLMLAKLSRPFDVIFQDGDKRLYVPLLFADGASLLLRGELRAPLG
jgi:predicted O-methyltransferase YrrM